MVAILNHMAGRAEIISSARSIFSLIRVVLLVIGISFLSWSASAQEAPLFPQHEEISYRVGYGPAHLADMNLVVQCVGTQIQGNLEAQSKGLARRVHPFRVKLGTRARIGGGSEVAQTWIEEKGELRSYESSFNGAPGVETRAEIRGRSQEETVELPAMGHDLLSWLFHLRRQVSRDGEQQGARRYTLWDGWKLVFLDVHPGERIALETEKGVLESQAFGLRRTRLFHDAERRFGVSEEVEELGTIWIELAPRALPVAMAFRAPIGQVRIELAGYVERAC